MLCLPFLKINRVVFDRSEGNVCATGHQMRNSAYFLINIDARDVGKPKKCTMHSVFVNGTQYNVEAMS